MVSLASGLLHFGKHRLSPNLHILFETYVEYSEMCMVVATHFTKACNEPYKNMVRRCKLIWTSWDRAYSGLL